MTAEICSNIYDTPSLRAKCAKYIAEHLIDAHSVCDILKFCELHSAVLLKAICLGIVAFIHCLFLGNHMVNVVIVM